LPNSPRTELFLKIKQVLRNHADWTDDQVAEQAGVKAPERDLIAAARRDLEAG
jgi:hypothetical protein